MDKEKAGTEQGEPGDINIFLFSNGEAQAPPRKYHLTAHELEFWNSTLNFLARAHYGYSNSIDLYTIDGKKVESPLELANNNIYVAVKMKDTFVPGGYDQYLMKASKSWIKRYGSISTSTSSKEKVSGTVLLSDKNANSGRLEKVAEQTEIKEHEKREEIIATALVNVEMKDTNENSEMTKPLTNNDVQKQGEKKKTTPRSSLLRKNIPKIRTNDKNSSNTKDKPLMQTPLKKRPGSPSARNSNNKVIPPRKESLTKALNTPGKPKHVPSQITNKNSAVPISNIGPVSITPVKLPNKPESEFEPISNGPKKVQQDVDKIIIDEREYSVSLKPILSPHDDSILKTETSASEYAEHETCTKVTNTLQTIDENVDGYYELTRNTKLHDNSVLTKSFSTEMQHGDMIKLRLSIEVTQGDNDHKSQPLTDELWSIVIKEKCSQVNMDELVFQKETVKDILDEIQKNKPEQNYVILHCDCCNNNLHRTDKLNQETINNQPYNIKRVGNNKDYIVLLPCIKPDNNLLGCKCDETAVKSDKIMQTSVVFEATEYPKVASCKQTVDQTTETYKTVSHHCSNISVYDRACGTAEVFSDKREPPTPLSSKEGQFVGECPACSNTPKAPEVLCNTITYSLPPPPKEKRIVPADCLICRNKPKARDMFDKSTQTDTYCFLLEVRRQADGHYSFHLPPLDRVKFYRY